MTECTAFTLHQNECYIMPEWLSELILFISYQKLYYFIYIMPKAYWACGASSQISVAQSTLNGWCGRYHAGCPHFLQTFPLIPNLSRVNKSDKVNYWIFFEFSVSVWPQCKVRPWPSGRQGSMEVTKLLCSWYYLHLTTILLTLWFCNYIH